MSSRAPYLEKPIKAPRPIGAQHHLSSGYPFQAARARGPEMTTVATFPSAEEVAKTDAFPTTLWRLEPHREGELPVAAGRGGPFKIHWEVHGEGDIKLIRHGSFRQAVDAWEAEFAYAAPHRIASLNLICTAAAIENTTSFSENMINRVTMLLPKSLDRTITYTASNVFPADWLEAPDDAVVPDETVSRCSAPEGGWPYRRFGSNYARFAAQEITKQRDLKGFTRQGFLLQMIAAGWHHKSAAQLREIGDKVGRERILVIHGTADKVISIPHGRKLIEYLQPGKSYIVDEMGHAPIVERTQWFNELLTEMCTTGEQLSGR
ncbi:hypothetical protein FHL15_005185 [Xylaria flabelliformis]|uniref:AB hydrolase-1 domain-containing protein n=1 Tax=Xylaria flabelliformis TaxID=2512241 RepID=A0A553I0S1_9PEZI|nr:hypothetical protein FHL15_005185 [Xylaria flabelliformis]